MQHLKYTLSFTISMLTVYTMSCSDSSPTDSIDLSTYNERWFGGFEIQNNNLVVSNGFGPITILGNGLPDTVRTYMYKTISAETRSIANTHFNDIVFEYDIVSDTVICSISAPNNSSNLKYYSSLELEVYRDIATYIKSPNSGASFSYMDNTIYVLDSSGDIEIIQHNGSCDVKTSKGDIEVEMIITTGGFCRSYTSSGDIVLEIPSNSSASIYAKTNDGTISHSNLDILNIQESPGSLQGMLTSGGGQIYLETEIGNIEIIGF